MAAAVLWTGGKDSALALDEAKEAGIDVKLLATFTPENPDFHAHPLSVMRRQAECLNIPHRIYRLPMPSLESYILALQTLKKEGIDTIITGDIDQVNGYPNWIEMCCSSLDLHVLKPLWQRDRKEICQKILSRNLDVIISCVNLQMLPQSFLGRRFNKACINDLQKTSADICGENGEFHTMTLQMPYFRYALKYARFSSKRDGDFAYLDWQFS